MILAALSSTEDPVLVLPTLRVSFLSSKVLMFTGFSGIGAMGGIWHFFVSQQGKAVTDKQWNLCIMQQTIGRTQLLKTSGLNECDLAHRGPCI